MYIKFISDVYKKFVSYVYKTFFSHTDSFCHLIFV